MTNSFCVKLNKKGPCISLISEGLVALISKNYSVKARKLNQRWDPSVVRSRVQRYFLISKII